MRPLSRQDLYTLERYSRERAGFRRHMLDYKKRRAIDLGPNVRVVFEDRLTVQYQVQEMLRVERIDEPAGIADELEAYNPLIPDGGNLKATMLIACSDAQRSDQQLTRLAGIETRTWLQVSGFDRVAAKANDADSDAEAAPSGNGPARPASVHFLRFDFEPGMIDALRVGADLAAGIDHAHYGYTVNPIPPAVTHALARDFD